MLLDASGWIELLDAVDYGGPQRSSCGPVSRRVRLGWRSLGGRRGDSNPVAVRAQLETPLPQSLPQSSGVTGSRPTLALVNELTGAALDVLVMVDELTGSHRIQDGGPRFARLRGDRRETDARGRAERPSKWRG